MTEDTLPAPSIPHEQTILIVDDSTSNVKILAALLSSQGRIIFALNGPKALEMVAKEQPDLILLDVMMPEMSGYDICRILKSDPKTEDIPVIFVTALSEEDEEEEGLNLGAIDYIIKPFKPAIIQARIANILKLQDTTYELRQANIELTRLATTDPLTGAANRRHFLESAHGETLRAQRTGQPLGVVMADIDHFKSINDTYGHDIGDIALIETVNVLQEGLRQSDLLGRFGGEEFALYLPETDKEGTLLLANRLKDAIQTISIDTPKGPLTFTCSLGVHLIDQGGESIEEALKKADEALYRSKKEGRNRVTLYADG